MTNLQPANLQPANLEPTTRSRYARRFGLPPAQVRLFAELTEAQRHEVNAVYSLYHADRYVYAVKRSGALVWNRFRLEEYQ